MQPSTLSFPAADGFALEGEVFEPGAAPAAAPGAAPGSAAPGSAAPGSAAPGSAAAGSAAPGSAPAAAVVFASAMGVRRRFYGPLAQWLSARGFAALTFDYRGVGRANRRVRAAMHDWGEQDLEGALRFALQRWPGIPLTLVGHSAGGQLIGLAPSSVKLSAIATVAAQSGYWRHWPFAGRARMAIVWHLLLPVLPRLLGYAPLSKLTGGQDVPAGVAIEWARWGRHPDYIWSYARDRPNCYARGALAVLCHRRRQRLCPCRSRSGAARAVSQCAHRGAPRGPPGDWPAGGGSFWLLRRKDRRRAVAGPRQLPLAALIAVDG